MIDVDLLLKEAAQKGNCDQEDILWFSWPQVFGSSAGPCGIGGQTITSFQVFAFEFPGGKRLRCCCGRWKKWNGEFQQPW